MSSPLANGNLSCTKVANAVVESPNRQPTWTSTSPNRLFRKWNAAVGVVPAGAVYAS